MNPLALLNYLEQWEAFLANQQVANEAERKRVNALKEIVKANLEAMKPKAEVKNDL